MSMMRKESDVLVNVCMGCGAALQMENQHQPGYVPSSAMNREHAVCKRCYQITHYNQADPVDISDDDFLKVLHKIGETDALVVKIIDLFDFTGSWISGLQRFVGNNPILIVANKIDLFPKIVNENKLKNRLQQWTKEMGLKPVDILFCSAEKGTGMAKVTENIEKLRRGGDVYIVGTTNVGKSTFINYMLKQFEVDTAELITTSRFPGTTLDLIGIPIKGNGHLYDTPGIINRKQMAHVVSPAELQTILPVKSVKARIYQLNAEQTLFFGGLARIDFVQGEHQPFVCYFSNELMIHRTKLEKANDLYAQHVGGFLSPPAKADLDEWPGLRRHHFEIPETPTDIVILGLGWIQLKNKGAYVDVYAPDGVEVSIRPALI